MAQTIPDAAQVVRRINRWTLRVLTLVGRVRPDERRDVLGAFLVLFGFMAGHAMLETARDALFLASLPARRLPWVYLAIAVLAVAIGQREPRVVRRLSARNELGRWLTAAGVVTTVFWLVVRSDVVWALYALYVWSGVIVSLVIVRFWTILSARFTVTQAKRLFPLIASGSVAGAIFGSGAARILTEVFDARHLVLAAAAAFFASSAAPSLWSADAAPGRRRAPWSDLGDVTRTIVTRPYLLRLAGLVLLATITFTFIDFIFKSVADRQVRPEDLGAFFASTYLVVNILSLLVQLGLVGWLLRSFGLVNTVIFVPAVLLVSTLGFAAFGGLTLALVLKGADGALRHSAYRTGTELLFVPLSNRIRTQVKGVIDVLGQRGGQALGSVLILMLLSTTTNLGIYALLACVTAVGWLLVAGSLREHYLDLFRESLRTQTETGSSAFPALDQASIETLISTLSSPDDRRVIAALELLASQGRMSIVPVPILYHPSSSVVECGLDLFAASSHPEVPPVATRLLSHSHPDVRSAALRALCVMAPSRVAFEEALRDGDPRVVATARVAMITCGWDEERAVEGALMAQVHAGGEGVRLAVARALHARPSSDLEPLTMDLITDRDPSVAREAIAAAGELAAPRLLEPLILALGRRAVRDEARGALVRFETLGLTRLAEALDSPQLPQHVRSQIPGAIALSGAAQAPAVLLAHLRDERDGLIRFKVLRSLGRWRREQPGFPLDLSLLQGALTHAVSTGFQLMRWRHALEDGAQSQAERDTEVHRVLLALLRDKQDHALERAFRLLNLESGSDEFQRVYRGLHSPIPQTRAGSRELLAHMVIQPLRDPIMTLVDDLHGEEGGEGVGFRIEPSRDSYAEVLIEIVGCGMESASSLAATQAADLRIGTVLGALETAAAVSEEHGRTLARAADILAGKAVA